MWPVERLTTLLGIRVPIIQAPMAGASDSALAAAVCTAGGLGSLPCAMLNTDVIRAQMSAIRKLTQAPVNLNFFCHIPVADDAQQQSVWLADLAPFYEELGIPVEARPAGPGRAPFAEETCALVEELRPEVVSFHFGLPDAGLLQRVKASGAVVLSSATTVAEARWLESHGCDAIIAQGAEAGGHRGMFLSQRVASQPGTLSLVPQVCDAVSVPVIAAGGIADGRGIAAAMALGASGVQIGTAFLFTPEARISETHRLALLAAEADGTALTNVFSGRPARSLLNRAVRELGPLNAHAPAFPHAGHALAPLRAAAEAKGSGDFSPLWSGQSAGLGRAMTAQALIELLEAQTLACLQALQPRAGIPFGD